MCIEINFNAKGILMHRNDGFTATRKLFAATVLTLAAPLSAQAMVTYDFTWYSGAQQSWVYEAGARFFVDVFEDSSTPENDVFFRLRNGLDDPLTYNGATLDHSLSSLVDVQFDTGKENPNMFAGLSIWGSTGDVKIQMNQVGSPSTLLDQSGSISRIAWAADYAAGRASTSSPKTDGVNPGESVTLRAVLGEAYSFADVLYALEVGGSSTYVDKEHYGLWTTGEKNTYRAGASEGLRLAILTQSIVPNTWHPDGHGLYVTHGMVAAPVPEAETWAMMLAGLGLLALVARRRKAETFRCL